MIRRQSRNDRRIIRHQRVRRSLHGTPNVPRLSVFKSLRHIYAQIIDDASGNTIVSASSLSPQVKEMISGSAKKKVEEATIVGKYLAGIALAKGIKRVSFDRGGSLFHGRIKALADGAREAGLEF